MGPDDRATPGSGRGRADVYVPDGIAADAAFARTTDLGIVAHPDDLELILLPAVAACAEDPDRWFTGIVCTDGAGSVRSGTTAGLDDDGLVAVRRAEQREAAALGGYAAVVQLGWSSATARAQASTGLVDALHPLLDVCSPVNLWTHDLTDAHLTHVAVGLAALCACRRLSLASRPQRAVGVEGWRSLDWLPEQHRIVLDTSRAAPLGSALAAVFQSQLGAGKRYDTASEGRRVANATFADQRAVDEVGQAVLAMDLTAPARNDSIDPVRFVEGALAQFATGAGEALRAAWSSDDVSG